MTYKKLFLALPVAMMTVALTTSCSFEQDEYFDESASLRVTHQNETIKNRLVAQSAADKYGWVLQYFVAGTDDYNFEGFNLFGRFNNNGTVTLASDHKFLRNGNAGKYTEHTSYYDMLAEEGSVLAFNTWNDILTVFVDPVDPTNAPDQLINNGEGMYGDQNLVLKKLGDTDIQFYGERHGAISRLVPCDRPWQQYIADTKTMKKSITTSTLNDYYVVNGADTLFFTELNKGLFTYAERIQDPLQKKTLKCVFTPKGFRLERPDSLGDAVFQEFSISDDQTCLQSEDKKVKVIACWDTYIINGPSDWRIDPESFTPEQTALYQQMEAEVKKVNNAYVLDSILIGHANELQDDNTTKVCPGLFLYVHGPKKMGRVPQYKPYIDMAINRQMFGKVEFVNLGNEHMTENMKMFKDTNLKELCEQFAETIYGSYDIVPNDYFRPTSAVLNPVESGNAIRLRLQSIVE